MDQIKKRVEDESVVEQKIKKNGDKTEISPRLVEEPLGSSQEASVAVEITSINNVCTPDVSSQLATPIMQ